MTDLPPPARRAVLITGSRHWPEEHRWLVEAVLADHLRPTDVVMHGGAERVDTWADEIALKLGCTTIPVRPDYTKGNPKAAPKERNSVMVQRIVRAREQGWETVVYGFQHQRSPGTGDCLYKATVADLDVHVWTTDAPGLAYVRRTVPAEIYF